MFKTTEYKVTGSSKVRPGSLPEGLEVVATEVKESKKKFFPAHGGTMRVEVSNTTGGVFLDGYASHFSMDQTRELRDLLNDLLGETPPSGLRKVVDGEGDCWFEIEPDGFILAGDRATAVNRKAEFDWDTEKLSEISRRYRGIRTTTFE